MKILQISSKVPYPATDGKSIAILNLSKSFVELGHEVTIIAMNTKKDYIDPDSIPRELKKSFTWHIIDVPAKETVGGAIWNLFSSKLPYNAERLISLRFRDKLIEIIKKEEFDVIQLEGLYLCPYISDIRPFTKGLIALRSHNIEHEIWKRKFAQTKGLKKHYISILSHRLKIFEHDYVNQYDVLVPITGRDGKILNRMGNHRPVHIAPAGINAGFFHFDRSKEKYPSLFFIGALDWAPNQEGLQWFFEHCWNEIVEKFPEVELSIAGRNAPQWIVKMLKQPNVKFLGEIPDAYEFINEHAVMIAPLLSGSGIRIKVVEGMALGKSVVTTSIGCEGIPVRSGEDIVLADTPEDFYGGVIRLLSDHSFHIQIGTNARKLIEEKLDNKIIAHNLIEFYKRNL